MYLKHWAGPCKRSRASKGKPELFTGFNERDVGRRVNESSHTDYYVVEGCLIAEKGIRKCSNTWNLETCVSKNASKKNDMDI